jgi:hypothetical protein|tara:strand:+ start:504 stop:719 length:216 start_codon:yes stop_codon:yes gene_type:complete
LIQRFVGAIYSLGWKEALWDKYVMAAPRLRTQSEKQYGDRKLRTRRKAVIGRFAENRHFGLKLTLAFTTLR